MFVLLLPSAGPAQSRREKDRRRDSESGWVGVCVRVGPGGVLPWCPAPNGIRGEWQREGDKVKLRCCQLWLTTKRPDISRTGVLSRHRSHSLSPHFLHHWPPSLSPSQAHFFLLLLSFSPPAAPPASCQCFMMQKERAGPFPLLSNQMKTWYCGCLHSK